MKDHMQLVTSLIPLVRAAGDIELKYYRAGHAPDADVVGKSDGSPVTLADQEAEALITSELMRLTPDIPIVGEEAVAAGHIPDISSGRFYLVDPLDGTREFITGGGEFTVNIALMENFRPVMGIIFAPVSGALYYAAEGQAFRGDHTPIRTRPVPDAGLSVVSSKRHGDPERLAEFLAGYTVAGLVSCSSSLKFCVIAEGSADLYPRLGPTCEWDTAAGEAILRAAGGSVLQLDGKPLEYGKTARKFINPEFVARSVL